jgi:hypothetical protein
LSYHEFTAHLQAPSVSVTKTEALQLALKAQALCEHFKRTGSFEGIEPPSAPTDVRRKTKTLPIRTTFSHIEAHSSSFVHVFQLPLSLDH